MKVRIASMTTRQMYTLLWIPVLTVLGITVGEGDDSRWLEPPYESQAVNVTVIEGKTATLPCSVPFNADKDLKVVWTDQWSTILTFKDQRVIDDERIAVDHAYDREWNLRIDRIKHADQGIYTCQVNTKPMRSLTVHLTVVVPPRLSNDGGDVLVKEGGKAELVCNATGIPAVTITWYRKAQTIGQRTESEFCTGTSRIGEAGQVLVIHNVTRFCGGEYECVAENGVPPSVRREIHVRVQFEPEISLPNKRIGQAVGKDTILECVVSAYPQAVTMWKFHGKQISNSEKYSVSIYQQPNPDMLTLSLYIKNLEPDDFGKYNCIASNALGETSKKMTLYEHVERTKPTPTTTTTTTTTSTTSSLPPTRQKPPQADRRVDGGEGVRGQERSGDDSGVKPQPLDSNRWEPNNGLRAGPVATDRNSRAPLSVDRPLLLATILLPVICLLFS